MGQVTKLLLLAVVVPVTLAQNGAIRLSLHGGDVAAAAQALGVSKSTLYRRLASLGLGGDADRG